MKKFEGALCLRQRLVMATISGKPIRIDAIRPDDDHVGLKDYEITFLRLIERITNGCVFEISYTGTSLTYRPGVITGGTVTFDCGTDRAIGYFLEPILALAPFSKHPFNITLTGITNDTRDTSVDIIRTVLCRHFRKFGIDDVELKVTKRGAPPLGGGLVTFRSSNIRQIKPIQFVDEGRIKRIRGIAYATRVSPQIANRLVESSRALLNRFIPDVFIYTDVYRGQESGSSPGFALALVAESTTGALYSAECTAKGGETPEDVGLRAAKLLYREISLGGSVDTVSQWLHLLFMAVSTEDVSKVRFGKLSPFSIQYLRDLKEFFNLTFKIKPSEKTALLTCVGTGYTNTNKKTT